MIGMLTIGVLAVQGAVSEHLDCIKKLGHNGKLVYYPRDFDDLDGLILPGGESTTMAIVCEESGLFDPLRKWVKDDKKPTYGTCAGMILLSDHAIKTADGGQSLLGGLDVYVCRNYFGSQIYSTTVNIESSSLAARGDESPTFPAVFIRAPAILKVGSEVETLATVTAPPHRSARSDVLTLLGLDPNEQIVSANGPVSRSLNSEEKFEVKIAVRQGNILATAFHPELTNDLRWHKEFIAMCEFSAKR